MYTHVTGKMIWPDSSDYKKIEMDGNRKKMETKFQDETGRNKYFFLYTGKELTNLDKAVLLF